MISEGHEKAKAVGMDAVKRGLEYVRVQVLGQAPKEPSPQPSRNVSYSTFLMDRFAMPSARQGLAAAGTSDIFNLLGNALQQTTYPDSTSREAQAEDLAQSGTLVPPSLSGEERTDFIATQRGRLQTLLQAFDNEAYSPAATTSSAQPHSSMPRQPSSRKSYLAPSESTYMHKSRSESEFEDLGYETMPDPEQFRPYDRPAERQGREAASGGWSNWIWGNYG